MASCCTKHIKILTVVSFPLFLNLFSLAVGVPAFSLVDILLLRFLRRTNKNEPEKTPSNNPQKLNLRSILENERYLPTLDAVITSDVKALSRSTPVSFSS